MTTAYNQFVKAMMPRVQHLDPRDRMTAISRMWAEYKKGRSVSSIGRGGVALAGGGAKKRATKKRTTKTPKSEMDILTMMMEDRKPPRTPRKTTRKMATQRGRGTGDVLVTLDSGHVVDMKKDLHNIYGLSGGAMQGAGAKKFFRSIGHFFSRDVKHAFEKDVPKFFKDHGKEIASVGISLLPALL